MNYETVSADQFGRSLHGLGLNILVRNVRDQVAFLTQIFAMQAHRISDDFAIMTYADQVFQLHSDATYSAHPLLGLLPETPPRGAGVELRLYNTDPDEASRRAISAGALILQPPADKPHGLRECYILCPNGYAWVPSCPTKEA